jgi:hypothetical protein
LFKFFNENWTRLNDGAIVVIYIVKFSPMYNFRAAKNAKPFTYHPNKASYQVEKTNNSFCAKQFTIQIKIVKI